MALPMMAGTAVHTIYIIADTAFIGTLGTEALAAVTFVGPLFFVMVTLTMGMATAVTALVAQAVGRREPGGADAIAGTALTIGLGLGVGLCIGGLLLGRDILGLLGAEGETRDLAWEYFEVVCFLVPLFFVGATLRSVLTGEGDARTPTVIMAISTVINLSLDALFIFGLGWSLRGAALATGAAQLFSLSAYWVLVVRRPESFVRFRPGGFVPSRLALGQIAALAVPTSAGMMVMSVGGMALNRVISEFGEVAVAAYGAASKVDMIVAMPIFGLSGAAVAVVGMFAGAGRVDLVRSTAFYAYRWALTLAVVIGAAAFLSSGMVLRIFTRDAEALAIGRVYLGYMIFAYPMMAFGMTSGRLLQGLGHGVPSMIITSTRVLLVAVPAAYISIYLLGWPIQGVWGSLLMGGVCSNIIAFFWVRHLVWKRDPTARARAERGPIADPLEVVEADPELASTRASVTPP
jgi:putative MATE family efflux protein